MPRFLCGSLLITTAAALMPCSAGAVTRPALRKPLRFFAAEDPEIDKWARDEAAKTAVDAMYLKAANEIKTKRPTSVKLAIGGYALYALAFTLLLVKTLASFPLIPPSPNSLLWCRTWLATTVVDYYGAALALCGVIVSSEPKLSVGLAWSAGCCFLGTPFCCLYVAVRLLRRGSLRLAD